MEVLRRALTTRASHNGLSAAGVGYLAAQDRGSMTRAADLLLREEGINRSLVFGILRDPTDMEWLAGIYRTNQRGTDPIGLLRAVFEGVSSAVQFETATATSCSFRYPLGASSRHLSRQAQVMKWQFYEELTLRRIAQVLLARG